MLERLAKDKDFQDYVFFAYEFSGKVRLTKTAKLLDKVFNKKATESEETDLLCKLGFNNRSELNKYLSSNLQKGKLAKSRFSELQNVDNFDEIIISAAQKVVVDTKIASKVVLRPLTCFEQFIALTLNCTILCAPFEDYQTCYEACFALAFAWWGTCELLED